MDCTSIYRWVQRSAPELEKRCRPHLRTPTDSWRVDETYIKVKKQWMYLYRAVDSQGNTLYFFLSPTRDAHAAKQFLLKTLAVFSSHFLQHNRGYSFIHRLLQDFFADLEMPHPEK